jgi:hypothetical protein
MPYSFRQGIRYRPELGAESRDVLLHDCPNKFEIDPKILVDRYIPECNDLPPGNLGMRLANRSG